MYLESRYCAKVAHVLEMMSNNLDDDLLDVVRAGAPHAYRSWEPDAPCVVLGRGNAVEQEVFEERCQAEHIPILRRRGGGGTVVLSSGVLVVSLVKLVKHPYHFAEYFFQINGIMIDALRGCGVEHLHQRGISDICLGDRKIAGSSMYRSKSLLFYAASLMVNNDLTLLDRYLKHPSKEPDYRQGRPHGEFVTTLAAAHPGLTVAAVQPQIDRLFLERMHEIE